MRTSSVPTGRAAAAVVVAGVAVTGLLTGCAALQEPEAAGAATAFAAAAPADRCGLLAAATVTVLEAEGPAECVRAMTELPAPGDVVSTSVWGDAAQVHLTGDTMFLTSTGAGWRVAAAGCRSQGDAPYACQVSGP